MRTIAAAVLTVVSLLCLSSPSTAQSPAGPQQGDWGGDVSIGGGSASWLRFRGPESAWVMGFTGLLSHQDVDDDGGIGGAAVDVTSGFLNVSLGLRRYRSVPAEIRPFTTWGLNVSVSGAGAAFGDQWSAGPFFELGAAYLLREHVMLSVSGTSMLRYHMIQADSFSGDRRTIEFSISAPRVALLVYF